MKTLPGQIAIDTAVCGRRPHFVNARIPVYVVLEILANWETWNDIHADYVSSTEDDIHLALELARNIADVPRQSPVPVPA
jgi:uncharacterized protein (DUF433 family)